MIKICQIIRPDFKAVEGYLTESFATGQLSNGGPCYKLLCQRLAQRFQEQSQCDKLYVAVVSSGHTALTAAYAAADIYAPLIPAYTFRSTWLAVPQDDWSSYTSCFSDVSKSGCIAPQNVEEALKEATLDSVVAVTALSVIPDLAELDKLCFDTGKKLIIDAAPGFGTPGIYDYGVATCLSFHATKTLPIGECGAVVSRDPEIIKHVERYVNFGFGKGVTLDGPGFNGKVSEYTCAIGLSLLDVIDIHIHNRLKNAALYRELLPNSLFPVSRPGTVYQVFPIFLEDCDRADLIGKTLAAKGIQTLKYYPPLGSSALYPVAKSLYDRNVCLPVHGDVSEDDIKFIAETVKSCL